MQTTLPTDEQALQAWVAAQPRNDRVHLLRNGFMYAGTWVATDSQRNSAMVYLAASPDDFEISGDSETVRTRAALVMPSVKKRLHALGQPFVCFDVFPTHRSYRVFAGARGPGVRALPHETFAELADGLCNFHSGKMSGSDSDALYRCVVERVIGLLPPLPPIDPRVREVMQRLRDNRDDTVQALAESVHMSQDWLSHLFRRETGISLRKYEQSLKVQVAASMVGQRLNLTEVAAMAGFADSAHFSRVWKAHFGVSPNRFFIQDGVSVDPVACVAPPVMRD